MTFSSMGDNDDESMWRSPLSALITINSRLNGADPQDTCLRAVNFMSYELATLCHGKDEETSFYLLNEFFFHTKKFKLTNSPCLLKTILQERAGCGIALGFLYIHLAHGLGLRFQLVHWPLHAILKWERENKCCYFDLEQNGKLLSEEDLLLMINKHKDQVRTLEIREALVQYLTYLSISYRQNDDMNLLHRTLGLILLLEPENTRFLAERALLRKEIGLIKESLSDFKRFFSFTDRSMASPELINAYEQILLEAPYG